MADNQQWLDAGVTILEEHGARALTIERLAEHVGLSKGSFYHHFGGMPGYKTALLAHYETTYTGHYIDAVEQEPDTTARAKLEHLADLACGHDPEVALRAWALQDPEVHDALERIDRIRTDYLRSLSLELSGDEEQAELMSRLIYLITIGSGHVIPPVPSEELRALYAFTIGLLADGQRVSGVRT